jgi:hypothetical protein
LKEVTDACRAHADKHFYELASTDGKERNWHGWAECMRCIPYACFHPAGWVFNLIFLRAVGMHAALLSAHSRDSHSPV